MARGIFGAAARDSEAQVSAPTADP
jgi:hypothetical protein